MPIASHVLDDPIPMSNKPIELDASETRQRLEALLSSSRQTFVASIERGAGGVRGHEAFSDALDYLIRDIVSAAELQATAPGAVAALGGYGRRALCLHSDIDLLIVFDGAIDTAEEQFVKAVLHPLWDLGLTVGHHVRELRDFDELERDNPEFLLAMLDARLLAGDASVLAAATAGQFRTAGHQDREGREELLEALLQLTEERHRQFNGTIYQLEPNIKEAPGGLRDIGAARVLLSLAETPDTASAVERERLDQAEDLLLRCTSMRGAT